MHNNGFLALGIIQTVKMSLWGLLDLLMALQGPSNSVPLHHMIMKMQTTLKPCQTNKANEKCFAIRLNDFFVMCLRNRYPLTHTHTLDIQQQTTFSPEMNTIMWFFDFHRTENLKAVLSLSLSHFI